MQSIKTATCALALFTIALLGLGPAPQPAVPAPKLRLPETPPASIDALDDRVEPARAETLSYVIQAGEVLIFNLPGTLGTRTIDAYLIKRAPALSWLVTRSFFWRTLAKDVGKHEVHFKAVSGGRETEDVVVLVEVR